MQIIFTNTFVIFKVAVAPWNDFQQCFSVGKGLGRNQHYSCFHVRSDNCDQKLGIKIIYFEEL